MSRRAVLLSLVFATPILAAVYFLAFAPRASGIDSAIRQIGFYPVTPPTTLRNPGSIYQISRDGKWYTVVCAIDNQRLLANRSESSTERMVANELTKLKIGVASDILEKAKTSQEADILRSLKYTIDNVKVYEISIANLAKIASELMANDENCRNQVISYLKAGDYVCQIQQVFQATVKYVSSAESGSDGSSLGRLRDVVKANIDADVEIRDNRDVSGQDLYYGMRPSPRCLFLPDSSPPDAPVTWWNRVRSRPLGLGFF